MKPALKINAMIIFLFIISFFILSCGPKIIPKEMEERIDKKLSFREVKKDPEAYTGKRILVGGEIIETRNLKDNTEIEILQKPLGPDRAPLTVDESDGRFILIHPSFLDPTVFRSGRRITAVGLVKGGRSQMLGEMQMIYPILEEEHIYLWPIASLREAEPSIGFSFGIGAIFGR